MRWQGKLPDDGFEPEGEEHWRRRQDALGIGDPGETLQPHEIEFYERFTTTNRVRLIPRDVLTFLPTSDFVWLDNDKLVIELKTSTPDYGTIKRAIAKAVRKTQDRPGADPKRNFMVNIRNSELAPGLAERLAEMNLKADRYKIERLFVYTCGEVVEIALL
ncbi:MAG: hypothetical protein LBL55_06140 [Propionibacteriaceae bacterium]|jgi:hypothetical protein|nr:hypothetical protein [Propionibacteriaceae bacterium]